MTADDNNLAFQELRVQAPGARAFRLEGALVTATIPAFVREFGRALNPRPRRVFLDVKALSRIDRHGLDTLAGLAGFFGDLDGGYLALVGAPRLLQEKLAEPASDGHLKFFANFGQGAVKVMDTVLVSLSQKQAASKAAPVQTTETARAVWAGIRDAKVPQAQVLTLQGNFDKVSAPHFEKHWNAEFGPQTRYLILDLEGLRSVVDDGIEWMHKMVAAVRARDGRVLVANARPKIKVLFDMLDMSAQFELVNTVDEAEQSLGRGP